MSQAASVLAAARPVARRKVRTCTLTSCAGAAERIAVRRLQVAVSRALRLPRLPSAGQCVAAEPARRTATRRAKFDTRYQKRWGITSRNADDLEPAVREQISRLCKRIYRVLCFSGYARMDFRMDAQGTLYFLEANPNPHIGEE